MKKHRWLNVLVIILILLVLLVGGGYFVLRHYYSKMQTTDVLRPIDVGALNTLKEDEFNIVNIAILGIDRNADGSEGRSDAMKVVSLDFNNHVVKLTSFQRDTLVYIPAPKDDFEKLNHAFYYGKAPLTLKTLNYNFDLDLTRYVAFNFDAIEYMINELGGVDIDVHSSELSVTNRIIDELNEMYPDDEDVPLLTAAGEQLLSGRQAMAYMRNRTNGSDFTRMERQSNVILAIIHKASTLSYKDLLSLLNAILPYVETNLTLNEMMSYGTQVLKFDLSTIEQLEIPNEDDKHKSIEYNGYSPLYVMKSYQDLVKRLHAFIYNQTDDEPSKRVLEMEAAIYEKFGTVESD